ncbi:MAG: choice-of-anchor Q domain-containing protein, partial [Anaerolineales bacterium]
PTLANYHIPEGSPAIDAGLDVGITTDLDGNLRPQGNGYDIGAYEFTPAVSLRGIPASHAITLVWSVNLTLPMSTTWTIDYIGPIGDQAPPITGIAGDSRLYALTGLTNYTWYTFTLTTDPPWLADSVTLMPTDHIIYMPVICTNP